MIFLGKKIKKEKLLSLQCAHCGRFFLVGEKHQRVSNYCNDCKD